MFSSSQFLALVLLLRTLAAQTSIQPIESKLCMTMNSSATSGYLHCRIRADSQSSGESSQCLSCIVFRGEGFDTEPCTTSFTCLHFTFTRDSVLEAFMERFREPTYNLFSSKGPSSANKLSIVLISFNRTSISKSYLELFEKKTGAPFDSLDLRILRLENTSQISTVDNDVKNVPFDRFRLFITCPSKQGMLSYIKTSSGKMKRTNASVCDVPHTTVRISTKIVTTANRAPITPAAKPTRHRTSVMTSTRVTKTSESTSHSADTVRSSSVPPQPVDRPTNLLLIVLLPILFTLSIALTAIIMHMCMNRHYHNRIKLMEANSNYSKIITPKTRIHGSSDWRTQSDDSSFNLSTKYLSPSDSRRKKPPFTPKPSV